MNQHSASTSGQLVDTADAALPPQNGNNSQQSAHGRFAAGRVLATGLTLATLGLLTGCASSGNSTNQPDSSLSVAGIRDAMKTLLASDFKSKGPATLERLLNQDEVQRLCTEYPKDLPADQASALEQAQLKTIRYPANGQYLGDFKAGEAVAQNGRGMQSSDAPDGSNGGNCYACHQMSKTEISYGNIGPSLYQYGKLRGQSEEVLKYTWGKIWNAQAYRACSNMPRFGHSGILKEKQIQDLMALLLDPKSPVNQ